MHTIFARKGSFQSFRSVPPFNNCYLQDKLFPIFILGRSSPRAYSLVSRPTIHIYETVSPNIRNAINNLLQCSVCVALDPMIGNNPVLAAPLRGAALTIFGGAVDSGAESVIRLCMADEEAGDTSTHPCRRKGDGEDDRVQRWKACFQACLLRGSRTDENSFRVRV
eukprot:c18084_g1_i2 orf=421-918(+)